jgi:hypothetical protein
MYSNLFSQLTVITNKGTDTDEAAVEKWEHM